MTIKDKCAVGLVLFHPDLQEILSNLALLHGELDKVYLFDNTDAVSSESVFAPYDFVTYISKKENLGIAYALNRIMETAEKDGFEWVITFDQDSKPPKGIVSNLYGVAEDNPNAGIVCPFIYEEGAQELRGTIGGVKECITSGALTRISAWRAIGGFDELLFIDYVDYDYSERLIRAGWNIVQTPKAVLSHYVGVSRQEKLFGITVNVMNHSAFRKYYQARNWIYWQRKMGRFSLLGSLKHSLWWAMIVLFYEADKSDKLRAIARGTHDALFDRRFL